MINYMTHRFDPTDGYGLWCLEQVKQLALLGVTVNPIQHAIAKDALDVCPEWFRRGFMHLNPENINLQVLPADAFLPLEGFNIGCTMWEDDVILPEWIENTNKYCDILIATCPFYANLFEQSGVKVPIYEVGGGIDPDKSCLFKPKDRPFTFVCLSDRGIRKGMEVVFNAFRQAFEGNNDVRLIIKTRQSGHDYKVLTYSDSRVSVIKKDVDDMSEIFALADCYVYPSYGDGWGLTPRQAVSHGVPTIAPRHTGLTVGIDDWATCILETFERPKSYYGGEGARWFKPTVDETVHAMRWVYENPTMAKERATKGRQWLLANQTWKHTAIALKRVIEGCRVNA